MENSDRRLLLTGAGIAGLAGLSLGTVSKAGSLNPPGVPAPTGKTTTEIEPRTAVQSLAGDATAMKIISQPGSYYLTGNLAGGTASTAGIAITASNVTLDLCGFSVTGVAGMTNGIELRGAITNVTIRNGIVSGWPAFGVYGSLSSATASVKLEGLSVSGCADNGIWLIAPSGVMSAHVSHCAVSECGNGIHVGGGLVENCAVASISCPSIAFGIYATDVVDCWVTRVDTVGATAAATGISASTAKGCAVQFVGLGSGSGVCAGISSSLVEDCFVYSVGSNTKTGTQYGISSSQGRVSGCVVQYVGGLTSTGIVMGIQSETVEGCTVYSAYGHSTLVGISSTGLVKGCTVGALNGGGGGSGQAVGISGAEVVDCLVKSLTSSTTAAVTGIFGTDRISGCSTRSIANGGTGGAVCIADAAPGCRIEDNNVYVLGSTAFGIKTTTASFVARNHVTGSSTPYTLSATGQNGPIVSGATASIVSTSPWANFQL